MLGIVDAALDNPEIVSRLLPVDLTIDPQVLELCPRQLAIDSCILPIDFSDDALLIAMYDPLNIDKVDKIRFVLKRRIHIVQVPQSSLRQFVRIFYGNYN